MPFAHERIADDLRQRICSGALRPGDLVPSTRRLVADHEVAMATASKALALLRQEGWVRVRPGVGTVVTGPADDSIRGRLAGAPALRPGPVPGHADAAVREPPPGPPRGGELSRAAIVATAVRVADGGGIDGVSMRRVAAELGTGTMSLYRHVPSKDELLLMMREEVFGEHPLPAEVPVGWRAQLELVGRSLWAIYSDHPWLARTTSLTRPFAGAHQMPYSEWNLRALSELDPGEKNLFYLHLTLFNYVHGLAASLDAETQQAAETGVTNDDWVTSQLPAAVAVIGSGAFPVSELVYFGSELEFDLDALFEFGLARFLDGCAVLAAQHTGPDQEISGCG